MSEPSKYDGVARHLLASYGADATLVVFLGGACGHGCARAEAATHDPAILLQRRMALAGLLRLVADDIEKGITQPDQLKHRRGSA